MRFTYTLSSIGLIASSVLAAPAKLQRRAQAPRALYWATNMPSGNAIVSAPVKPDGTLGTVKFTMTGGNGDAGATATGPSGPDALFSQDSITLKGNVLLACNAGSNTLSMFSINPSDPTELTLVGQPVDTLGDFPNSVAYAPDINTACVVNAGKNDGVVCFYVDEAKGLHPLDSAPRKLNVATTTPPQGPAGTISDIFFSQNSRHLFVTVKGKPNTPDSGFIANYPIDHKTVGTTPIKSTPDGVKVLFGAAVVDGNHFIITDASFGAVRVDLDLGLGTFKSEQKTVVDGQSATCWAAFSPKTNQVYITDIAVNRVIEIDARTGQRGQTLNLSNGAAGNQDTVVGGDFVYTLAPSKDSLIIGIVDISGGPGKMKEVGNLTVKGMDQNTQGMAVYV